MCIFGTLGGSGSSIIELYGPGWRWAEKWLDRIAAMLDELWSIANSCLHAAMLMDDWCEAQKLVSRLLARSCNACPLKTES